MAISVPAEHYAAAVAAAENVNPLEPDALELVLLGLTVIIVVAIVSVLTWHLVRARRARERTRLGPGDARPDQPPGQRQA